MSRRSKSEYWKAIYWRYRQAPKQEKQQILNEFCRTYRCHSKYAIRKLNGPPPRGNPNPASRRTRGFTNDPTVLSSLGAVWEVAGYPWSVRLQALVLLCYRGFACAITSRRIRRRSSSPLGSSTPSSVILQI